MGKFGTLKFAGFFIMLAALVHFIALPLNGFGEVSVKLLPFGIIGTVVGFLFWRFSQKFSSGFLRIFVYVLFVLLLAGTVMAFLSIWSSALAFSWLFTMIAILRLIALASLFVYLWRAREMREVIESERI